MNTIIKEKSTDNVIKLNKALEKSLHDVDKEIIIRLDKSIPLINDIGKHLIKASGKRLRPLLTLAMAAQFNDYSKNYQKRLEEKREMVKKLFSVIRDKLVNWSETRQWDTYDLPKYDYESKMYDLKDRLDNFLKSQCKEETKNAFYKSKKGLELQKLDELEEKATDLLHSDMIGSEVLKQISLIAKQTQINMTIPTDTIKSLPNG